MSFRAQQLVLLLLGLFLVLTASGSVSGNLTLVAENFTWAENLWFDGQGHMFVADWGQGALYRLTPNVTDPNGLAIKEEWVSGFQKCLGLQLVEDVMLMVVEEKDGTSAIINISLQEPGVWNTFSTTECLGNGLAYDATNRILFTACEALFIPLLGKVLGMSVHSPSPYVYAKDFVASDGAYVIDDLLFISESILAKVIVYNLTKSTTKGSNAQIADFKAPGMGSIDDFCVVRLPTSPNTLTMLAADFTGGNVVMIDALGGSQEYTVLATGLRNPTSVRKGFGSGWDAPGSFYVSEGGPLLGTDHNRRVWRLDLL